MKKHEYVYAGGKVTLAGEQAASFILTLQKAILTSLHKRGIITNSQAERCMELIKNK